MTTIPGNPQSGPLSGGVGYAEFAQPGPSGVREFTREDLFALHQGMTARALDLMKKKNADYSLTGPFGNFMMCEHMGLASAEKGILIRMTDKLSRLNSVLEKGTKVDESIDDTLVDIINYAVCLAGLRKGAK